MKTFHEAMELQATSDQAAAFRAIVKNTAAASEELANFEKQTDTSRLPGKAAELKASLEKVRVQTQNFVNALSAKQKAGLKETTARLEKAGTELAEQSKTLDTGGAASREQAALGDGLSKALENFSNQQDRLALEMGIVLSDEDVAFTIPAFQKAAVVGGQSVAITSSVVITHAGTENGVNKYKIVLTADLSDLEPNLTTALAAEFNGGERCGDRFTVEDAQFEHSQEATLVIATKIYAERWGCSRTSGESEIAQARGDAEVKATPKIGTDGQFDIQTELGEIGAKGYLSDSLHGGALGARLQEKIALVLKTAVQAADFKASLPDAAIGLAKMQAVRFQSTEGGDLSVILQGEMRMTQEQAKAFGIQLKQRSASQANAPTAAAVH